MSRAAPPKARDAEVKADQPTAQLPGSGCGCRAGTRSSGCSATTAGRSAPPPDNALTRTALAAQLVNGAGGPGTWPVLADSWFLQGELAIISVYCPDQPQQFQDDKDRLDTADVAG